MDTALMSVESNIVCFEVPSQPRMLSYIRSRVAEFASSMQFSTEDIQDIKLAVGEASANAVRYATTSDNSVVSVSLERAACGLKICISDHGCGFDPAGVAVPDFCAERGRGIMFMRALMDRVTFHFNNPGTRVEMIKKIRPLPSTKPA